MPGWAASKSLATLSELESASEVYQTTLPSLRAASTRASWADAGIAASTSVNANAPTRRVFTVRSSRCERLHEAVEARGGAERAHTPDHARGLLARHDEAGVPAELRLELLSRHRKLGAAPRMILTLLEPPSVAELDRDVAAARGASGSRSEEHTSELQSPCNLVCRLLLEKKKKQTNMT